MKIVDLFCGAGGESTGIYQAFAGRDDIDLLAINHWDVAIETHARNHPKASHMCETIQNVDPTKAVSGGRVDLLWASPECTHHSNARGGRPKCDQSRASVWLIMKWLHELYVDRVIIENVPEFVRWGPLGANGRPMDSKRGALFQAFLTALQAAGYRYEYRILNAADYGAATTRRRFFLQATRGRKAITWPAATHSRISEPTELGFDTGDNPWVPARDIIDWAIPSQSIFERKKPLAEKTLARIEHGIKKYWGEWAQPFLVILRGKSKTRSIDQPFPTVTSGGGHIGLVQPFLTQAEHGIRTRPIDSPMNTITCSSRGFGLVEPLIIPQHSCGIARSVDQPLPTIATKGAISLVSPFIVQYYGNGEARSLSKPLDTVTTKDRFALICGVPNLLDIRYRMLAPHELAAAQGFPGNYWFAGTKTQIIKQIGNAVPPAFAKALMAA